MPVTNSVKLELTDIICLAITDENGFKKLVSDVQATLDQGAEFSKPERELNKEYIKNKLDDIIRFQFGAENRGIIELIANSMDANAKNIEITDDNERIDIKDDGTGMCLKNLLYDLALPFYSEKQGKNTIGRFGLGFFSILGVLKKGGKVTVTSQKNTAAYQAVYTEENGKIFVEYYKTEPSEIGTAVSIDLPERKIKWRDYIFTLKGKRREFVKDFVQFIDQEKFNITYNGKKLNKKRINLGKKTKEVKVPFEGEEIKVILGRCRKDCYGKFYKLSGGIKVSRESYSRLDMVIDYPHSFQLIEGRNDFIENERFLKAQKKVFIEAVIPYVTAHKYSGLKELSDRYKAFINHYIQPSLDSASRDELIAVLGFYLGRDIPSNAEILANGEITVNNLHNFYPDALVVTHGEVRYKEELNLARFETYGHNASTLAQTLTKNPLVTDFSELEKAAAKKKASQLSAEEIEKYRLGPFIEEFGAYLDNTELYFLEGSKHGNSPYAATPQYNVNGGTVNRRIYVNINSIYFDDKSRIPESTKKSALSYFLKSSLFGNEEAERLIVCITAKGEEK